MNSSRFITVTGYDGFPMHVDASRIMSIRDHVDSTPAQPKCMVNMACENESEEWILRESAESMFAKMNPTTNT